MRKALPSVFLGGAGPGVLIGSLILGLTLPVLGFLPLLRDADSLDYGSLPGVSIPPLRDPRIADLLASSQQNGARNFGKSQHYSRSSPSVQPPVLPEPPNNDNFENARSINAVPYDEVTNSSGATRQSGEPTTTCAPIPQGGTLWYRFTPSKDESLIATTEGTKLATTVGVFVGSSITTLNQVACNSNAQGSSAAEFAAIANTTYSIQVASTLKGGQLFFGLHHKPGVTLASTASNGADQNGTAQDPYLSPSGRFLVFDTDATNLDPRCAQGCGTQVYLRDLTTGTVELISVSDNGAPANNWAVADGVSANGRYVTFTSGGTNLVANYTNERALDVYMRDRVQHKTILVSVGSRGQQGNDRSLHGKISDDGRYIAFWSDVLGFDSRYPKGYGIYRRDLWRGTTELASVSAAGYPANSECAGPQISGNGRFISFECNSTNLDASSTPDPSASAVNAACSTLLSLGGPVGSIFNSLGFGTISSYPPSSPGSVSGAPGPVIGAEHVWNSCVSTFLYNTPVQGGMDFWAGHAFVKDMVTGSIVDACTSTTAGVETYANGSCNAASLSYDGTYVTLDSNATNLVPPGPGTIPPTTGQLEVYVKNLKTGAIDMVSVSSSGHPATGQPGDGFWGFPVFRDLRSCYNYITSQVTSYSPPCYDAATIGNLRNSNGNTFASISADGRYVAFDSTGTNLDDQSQVQVTSLNPVAKAVQNVFIHDRLTGRTTRISIGNDGQQPNSPSNEPYISADGSIVAFLAEGTTLSPSKTTNLPDVFLWAD
ncbi:MAG: TolB family protein [Actinomycetota bacterium]